MPIAKEILKHVRTWSQAISSNFSCRFRLKKKSQKSQRISVPTVRWINFRLLLSMAIDDATARNHRSVGTPL